MRVLSYFGGRILESRGTPSRARNLSLSLAALSGVELLAVTGDSTLEAKRDLAVDHLPIPSLADRRACLKRAAERFRPDVIYGHTHKAVIEMLDPALASVKRVVDLHGDAAVEKWEAADRSWARRLVGFARARLSDRRRLPRMDAFTVVSGPLAERLRAAGRPTRVVWGGVDVDLFRSLDPPRSELLRVAYAGNYRPYQGVDVLIEAAHRLVEAGEPFEFSFVGDIDRFAGVKRAAREKLGERMTVHGQVAYRAMPEILAEAHILVIPRPAHETARFGFPSKLAEYLATGRPTVATRVGDMAQAIVDGETGLLVAPGSADELHRALLKLRDPQLRARLGGAGRRYAQDRLAWPVLARRVEAFLERVVSDRD